jgi:hypothetical protein
MSASHRFYFEVSLCVNKEVKVFNRKLQKIMKIFNHTGIINMSSNRGKECITNKTADIIKKSHKSKVSSYES